jgi:hypothetical protein
MAEARERERGAPRSMPMQSRTILLWMEEKVRVDA